LLTFCWIVHRLQEFCQTIVVFFNLFEEFQIYTTNLTLGQVTLGFNFSHFSYIEFSRFNADAKQANSAMLKFTELVEFSSAELAELVEFSSAELAELAEFSSAELAELAEFSSAELAELAEFSSAEHVEFSDAELAE